MVAVPAEEAAQAHCFLGEGMEEFAGWVVRRAWVGVVAGPEFEQANGSLTILVHILPSLVLGVKSGTKDKSGTREESGTFLEELRNFAQAPRAFVKAMSCISSCHF